MAPTTTNSMAMVITPSLAKPEKASLGGTMPQSIKINKVPNSRISISMRSSTNRMLINVNKPAVNQISQFIIAKKF